MTRNKRPKTRDQVPRAEAVIFPFDLFGSNGSGTGATLVGDELREIIADNRRERVSTRAAAYTDCLHLREFTFEKLEDYQDWRRRGRQVVRQILARGDFLVWMAGNHLGVLPVYDELAGVIEGAVVLQLDAHLDVHHFSECSPELSAGNFLLHAAGPLPTLWNAGHRELLLTPEHVARYYHLTFSAEQLALNPDTILGHISQQCQQARGVFLDMDCDVFDAAYFPAVAQPVPFGLNPQQVLRLVDAACSGNLLGVAVSEFHPAHDDHDRSLAILVWLLEYLLLRRFEPR
jgi:agmatinase